MSAAGEAQAEKDTLASGAKPRPEGRVREQGRRPTRGRYGIRQTRSEAAHRCAVVRARRSTVRITNRCIEGA
jgi:hypothetical protein